MISTTRLPVRGVVLAVGLTASLLANPGARADDRNMTVNVYGFADDISSTLGGHSGNVFLIAVCEADTTGPRPVWIDVTCNAYSGAAAEDGGTPSSGPTRNYAPAGTPLDGTDYEPDKTSLGNPTPGAGKGFSFWFGSSPTPAYVCIDAQAVYAISPPDVINKHACFRLAA